MHYSTSLFSSRQPQLAIVGVKIVIHVNFRVCLKQYLNNFRSCIFIHSLFLVERRMALQAKEVAWSGFITFFFCKVLSTIFTLFFACPLPFLVNVFLRRFIIQADFCSPLSCKKRQTFFALKF